MWPIGLHVTFSCQSILPRAPLLAFRQWLWPYSNATKVPSGPLVILWWVIAVDNIVIIIIYIDLDATHCQHEVNITMQCMHLSFAKILQTGKIIFFRVTTIDLKLYILIWSSMKYTLYPMFLLIATGCLVSIGPALKYSGNYLRVVLASITFTIIGLVLFLMSLVGHAYTKRGVGILDIFSSSYYSLQYF